MKAEDIRKMSAEDLENKEKELREELGNLAFQHRIRPLEDTSRLKKIRKDIARIETVKAQAVS
ncbi:50S ribosomal protein L29 [Desulfomarina profundi]|uniref:Large ribosomal subunit protein uL29 n=1 Tax=Desulfomarina profundi TaxID=2772557 RepID=A0A8D5FJ33_9BACT|nr:50S ribosomal protein L29 [Desulfomarina profundi]BCL59783.1 50S ribosomal protein L29 [Desulfomarina profundi]